MKLSDHDWTLCGAPVVERAKAEIRSDVASGRVPAAVTSFAELHDYVDANEYGGACEGEFDGSDEATSFWNRVQGEVDTWIKAGGLRPA